MSDAAKRYCNNWHGLLPDAVRIRQERWELTQVAVRMRRAGLTLGQIRDKLGFLAGERIKRALENPNEPSPVELYFAAQPPWLHFLDDETGKRIAKRFRREKRWYNGLLSYE